MCAYECVYVCASLFVCVFERVRVRVFACVSMYFVFVSACENVRAFYLCMLQCISVCCENLGALISLYQPDAIF